MSGRTLIAVVVAAAFFVCGGVFYWMYGRAGRSVRSTASASESPSAQPRSKEIPVADKSAGPASAGSTSTAASVPDSGPSLRAGEVLEFVADVSQLSNVASLRLQVAERRNFFGKNAWHLQAFARTENPLRMMFELDDQFDSYSDAGTLSSLQYEMHLNERGEKVDSVQRMTTTGKDPAPSNASQAHVLPGTRDPLGLMQYLRNVDWPRLHEVRSPVYDGHKLYDVRASLAGVSQPVEVPAGKYTASKIDIHVFDSGKELTDARFALYLANNTARTPVLLEAVMPFATARVQLAKVK